MAREIAGELLIAWLLLLVVAMVSVATWRLAAGAYRALRRRMTDDAGTGLGRMRGTE